MDKLTSPRYKKYVYAMLVLVITGLFLIYLKKYPLSIKETIKIKPIFLFYLFVLNLANKVITGSKIKKTVEIFKVRLSLSESLGLSIISNFYNYLAPKSGTAIGGVYLKNNHGLNYNKYLSVLIASALITVLTSGILGAAITLYCYLARLIDSPALFVIFFFLIIVPLVIFFLPKMNLPNKGLGEKVNRFFEGWHIVRNHRRIMTFLAFSDAGLQLCVAARYFIIFKMFSQDVGLLKCLIISPFSIITHFSTIIPGGYGIKEATVGVISNLTKIGFASGVIATLTDRVVMMTFSFILGPIFSFFLFKKSYALRKGRENEKL